MTTTAPMPLSGGCWNMERDRNPNDVAVQAVGFMSRYGLDFLQLAESSGYLTGVDRLAAINGMRLIHRTGDGAGETAILARADRDLIVTGAEWPLMTRQGWWTVRGHKTPRKHATTVLLNHWLEVAAIHTTPSVHWAHGRMVGPVLRRLSMRQHLRNLRRWVNAQPGAVLVAGDWNATGSDRGRYTPHWLARTTGSRVYSPPAPTHGHRRIDLAVARDCTLEDVAVHETGGSDHHLVTFTVSPAHVATRPGGRRAAR